MDQDTIYALTGVLAVFLGGMTVLIPVLGLTLRFALRPMVEAWTQLKSDSTLATQTELLSRQVSLLESELQQVQHTLQNLAEAQDFQHQLAAGSDVSR